MEKMQLFRRLSRSVWVSGCLGQHWNCSHVQRFGVHAVLGTSILDEERVPVPGAPQSLLQALRAGEMVEDVCIQCMCVRARTCKYFYVLRNTLCIINGIYILK